MNTMIRFAQILLGAVVGLLIIISILSTTAKVTLMLMFPEVR